MTDDTQARAAEVIERGTADESLHDEMCDVCEEGCCCSCVVERVGLTALKALDEAGMLATPEHDARVAAKALREAARALNNPSITPEIKSAVDAIFYLFDRADRIEREAGETDADA